VPVTRKPAKSQPIPGIRATPSGTRRQRTDTGCVAARGLGYAAGSTWRAPPACAARGDAVLRRHAMRRGRTRRSRPARRVRPARGRSTATVRDAPTPTERRATRDVVAAATEKPDAAGVINGHAHGAPRSPRAHGPARPPAAHPEKAAHSASPSRITIRPQHVELRMQVDDHVRPPRPRDRAAHPPRGLACTGP